MNSALIGALFCITPIVIWIATGLICYRWGRYGFPLEIRRRQPVDRRSADISLSALELEE